MRSVPDATDSRPHIDVTGEGVTLAPPDSCMIGVALEVMRDTAAAALREVTTIAEAAITRLREAGFADVDLPTRNLSVRDWFDQQTQRVTGRVASYAFAIVVNDLDAVPTTVETLSDSAGDALQIQGIAFTHRDPAPLKEAARRDAVADARARAEQLTTAAGLRVGPILAMREGTAVGWTAYSSSAVERASLPINPGTLSVTAQVTITFALEPAS
jgi:uncharacterized protein YggE